MDLLRFRAWLKKEQKMDNEIDHISWLEDELYCIGDGITYMVSAEDLVLMQSTGLRDKTGKEIFDGDIVRTTRFLGRADEIGGFYEYEKDYVGVVKVLEGSWVIDTGIVAVRLWSEIDESEVLGNIYENPELLEDE